MSKRGSGFVALLSVVAVSLVLGVIVGGKLNAPRVALAAPATNALELAPANAEVGITPNFADIVEGAMPAVVSVTSKDLPEEDEQRSRSEPQRPRRRTPFEEFFFFGDPERSPFHRREPRVGEGSGFIISPDGYILTNNHVVDGADSIEVRLQGGERFSAKVTGVDKDIDLALLKIDSKGKRLPTIALGDSDKLRVGEWVIAIGNPLEYEHTVTVGVVSGKHRRVPIGNTDLGVVSFIQTDAAINFGNSGGPLLDSRGTAVGINTAISRENLAEGIGFALPISLVRLEIERLRDKGFVKRGFIGITMNANAIDEDAQRYYGLPDTNGVIVSEVKTEGPADRAGIRREDIIRKVDGEAIKDNQDLVARIAAHQPGDRVQMELVRKDGERLRTMQVEATLADREQGLQEAGRRSTEEEPGDGTRKGGDVESTELGITVESLTPELRSQLQLEESQRGVVVTDTDYRSQASDKGLAAGVVITAVNDQPVRTVSDWKARLQSLKPGDTVKLSAVREGQPTYFYLKIPARTE